MTNILQPDYTLTGRMYQLALPMDIGIKILADDSVRLLNAVLERMDYRKLHAAYSRMGRIERSPESLFKILVYGYLSGIYSSRKLEQAYRRDLNFMFLLGGNKAPDHATIARFTRRGGLTDVVEDLFSQLVHLLAETGELSLCSVFIDGTKLEANANKYSFVWKKSTQKNETKMQEKMKDELPKLVAGFGIRFHVGEKIRAKDLKKLRKRLYALKGDAKLVQGKGKRKSPLQKAIEAVEDYLTRQKKHDDYLPAVRQATTVFPRQTETQHLCG
ncbi:MAG: transposase [bacterium]|nr:transposase [bacterium]